MVEESRVVIRAQDLKAILSRRGERRSEMVGSKLESPGLPPIDEWDGVSSLQV